MLCFSLLPVSPSFRCTSHGTTKMDLPSLSLLSAPRRNFRQPKAFFGRKNGKTDQNQEQEDFLASSWGGEQPDWTDAPDQRGELEEVWYEASVRGIAYMPLLCEHECCAVFFGCSMAYGKMFFWV